MKLVKTVKNFHRKNETGKTVKNYKIFKNTLEIGYRTTVTDEKKKISTEKLIRDFIKNV